MSVTYYDAQRARRNSARDMTPERARVLAHLAHLELVADAPFAMANELRVLALSAKWEREFEALHG